MNSARGVKTFQEIARNASATAKGRPLARHSAPARSVSRACLALLLAVLSFALSGPTQAQTTTKTIVAPNTKTAISVAVNPVTNKIYVANQNSNNLTVIDGATNTATVISDPNANTPNTVAVNPVTNLVYVTNINTPSVSVFTGAVGSTPASFLTPITNGNGVSPSGIAIDSHLNKIYVTDGGAATVWVINGTTNTMVGAVGVNQVNPQSIAVNPVTGIVYVADQGSGKVSVINGNLASPTLVNTLTVGTQPTSLAVNPVTNKIYVANNSSSNVSIIDGALADGTGSAIDAASPISASGVTGEASVAINPTTNQIYVASTGSSNTLIINGANNNTSIATDPNPNASGSHAVAVDTVTNTAYVANINSNTVAAINGNNPNAAVVDLAAGNTPQAIAVNPVTHKVYVADAASPAAVTVIDGATNTNQIIPQLDSSPAAIGINPVTNKTYIANSGDKDVSVIDGATNTLEPNTIGTGNTPVAIAVDPIRNQIYVVNNGDHFTTDIDGASGNTLNLEDTNASGSASIAFNPVTNNGFVVSTTSKTLTIFSEIFSSGGSLSDQGIPLSNPTASAVNPSNGQVFIIDNVDSQYMVVDQATGNGVVNGTGSAGAPTAVAINPVTNFAYIAGSGGVLVVNGANLGSAFISDQAATAPSAIAVNPINNLVYVANSTSNNVSVFQGATSSSAAIPIATITDPTAGNPQAIAINAVTNKIYVVNSGSQTITVIDGSTNFVAASISTDANPVAAAVNPITNEAYVVNQGGGDVTEITEVLTPAPLPPPPPPAPNAIQTNIAPLTNNTTSTTTPNFSFTATNTLTSAPLNNLYYQVDTWQGTWTRASGSAGSFSTTLPTQTPGFHIIYAFATDGQESTSAITGLQSSPNVGTIASYGFLVAPEIGQFFTLFGTTRDFGNQAEGVPSAANWVTLENEGGVPMNFTYSLNGAFASDFILTTPSGTNCSQVGGVLPANGQCQFWFEFQPSTLGPETVTLTAQDTTSGTPVPIGSFTITGTGVPQLSVTISGSGSVSDGAGFTCGTGTCTTTYAAGASVTLTAMPNSGSSFSGWTGDCSGTGACLLTMSASHNVTATFTNSGPTLSIGEAGTGSGSVTSNPSGITCQPACQASFSTGQIVTLTAVANPSSLFTGWSGGGCSGTGTCTVAMSSAQTVIAIFALTAGGTSCPSTGTTNWVGGLSGLWSLGSNWSPAGPPASGAIVCIADGASGAHAVTLDTNASVGGLYIDASGSLFVSNNIQLTVAGTVSNSGLIQLNSGVNEANLLINGAVTLTGGGTLQMNITGSQSTGSEPYIYQENSGSLTNVNNTIEGAGILGFNGLGFTNQAAGVVNANDSNGNTLTFTNNATNQGLIEATGKGVLILTAVLSNQGANLEAIGSTAQVSLTGNTDIQGGTLTTTGGGTLGSTIGSNGVSLDGSAAHGALTIVGTYTVQNNATATLLGTINNTGTISLTSEVNESNLLINGAVTLTGGGVVLMNVGGTQSTGSEPYIYQENSGSLTNVNNTIEGAGIIGFNGLGFTNRAAGVVIANDTHGNTLTINTNSTNQGLLEATGNGVLVITSTIVNQGANIKAIGSAATVDLANNTAIQGGTLTNSGATIADIIGNQNVTLDGSTFGALTLVGIYTVQNNANTILLGTINNTGTITLNSGANEANLEINGAVTLTGGGVVLMNLTGAQSTGSEPYIYQENSGALMNVNNIIEGAGILGYNGLVFTNQAAGVVNANDPNGNTLTLNTGTTNLGLIEATGKGNLVITSTIVNQGANIEAIGSTAVIQLANGAVIQGGTLTNSGATIADIIGNQAVTLDGITHGTITLVGTYTVQNNAMTLLTGTINNTGTIALNSAANQANLLINQAVTLTGGGTVLMNITGTQSTGSEPYIYQENSGSLLNVNNTIAGAGVLGYNGLVFTNQAAGVVNANDPNGNTLSLSTATTNQGLIEATGKGALALNITVNNQGATITAIGSTAQIELVNGADIQGGTLSNSGGTLADIIGNQSVTLDGTTHGTLTLAGTYTVQNNAMTLLTGTINNAGTIALNSAANEANLLINQAVTLTGGGTVLMNIGGTQGTSSEPYIYQENGGSLTNVNNTIAGAGVLGYNGLVLINQSAGVIDANSAAGNSLTVSPASTFSNAGLLETTGAGVMQINTTIDNSGVIFPGGTSAAPSTINQSGGFTQESAGALDVILFAGGVNGVSSSYSTNNGASLNGALNLIYDPNYSPAPGDSFIVLRSDVVSSPFASINSPAVPAGFAWFATYSNGQAKITLATSTNGNQTLTVSDLGTGTGTVTDDLGQINCTITSGVLTGPACSASYSMGSTVNLTATIGDSTSFGGWGGACSGNTFCSVAMNSAQSVTASFVPTPTSITLDYPISSIPVTRTAVFDCPSGLTPCLDANAHSLALTVAAVSAPFSVTVTATQIPPSQADGNCETGHDINNDFDCRFVSFFPGPAVDGGQREPLCDPYAAGNCVHYNIFSGSIGQEPPTTSYTGPVNWQIDWNNGNFTPPQPTYQPTPRLFDDPDYGVSETTPYGTSCTSPMLVGIANPQPTNPNIFCQFEFDITTSFNPGQGADPGIGGTTRQFNDVVVAFPLTVATPNLSATKTADSSSVNIGATVGFTISVANSTSGGTGSASNVALNDPLPGGAGVNWSISPAFTGPGTCGISGGLGAQILTCSFGSLAPAIGASVHVSSATSSNGSLANTATITADNNATLTSSASITVGTAEFFPSFSNLTQSQSIQAGTASITLSGIISAGDNIPPSNEVVTITIDGIATSAGIGEGGNFSTQFQPASIPASATPYTITYSYAGDATFAGATDTSTTLTVTGATGSGTLNITMLGSGIGFVSDDNDIECSESGGVTTGNCSGSFGAPGTINLTASATQPSTFIGWGGACASQGTIPSCSAPIVSGGVTNVTANFAQGPQSVTVQFNPGTNVMQSATFNCPTGDNPCTDPNAHALQLMVPTVISTFQVTLEAIEVPPGQANGDCSPNNTVGNDFDCRFATFFTFGTAGDGGKEVPLCDPYANGNCIHYLVFSGAPGSEPDPAAYSGGVGWLITWNNGNFTPPSLYKVQPELYDDPDYAVTPSSAVGTDCTQPMTIAGMPQTYSCQFEFDITTQFFPGDGVDPGIGGTTRQFNDVVVAYPPTNVPQLQATSTPDQATVTPGNPIGFTVTVTNSGSATATNVTVNDPLPTGTGIIWTFTSTATGCSITTPPNQVLTCTFATLAAGITNTIHVTSPTAPSGTYTNAATITINGQQLLTIATVTVTAPTTTAFSNLTPSQSITFGAPSIAVSGTISAGSQFPPTTESISITINGVTMSTPILANGHFQSTFPTAMIPGSTTPYPITYSYAGDTNFASATDSSTTLTVNKANQTISLTGAPASAAFGSTFTITATASSGLTVSVVATGGCSISSSTVTMTSGTTTCTLTANQAGNGNFNPAPQVVTTTSATKAASTTTLTSSPNPSAVGQTVTVNFKVTGTGGTPTGSVTVTAKLGSNTATCTGTLSSGSGSCSLTTLTTTGTWAITGVYSGDNNFTGSTSAPISQVVNPATSTLKFSPTTLNFGTLYPGQTQLELLFLTNTDGHMITFTNFSIASVAGADSNGFFGVSFCPRTLNPGNTCTIIMGFTADSIVTKPHSATLVVTDNAPLSPQTVPLTATVINPISRLSTNNLSFGNQSVHTTSSPKSVTLSNPGTTPLILSTISISGNFAFAQGTSCANNQTIAPNTSCNMNVTFTPSSKGSQSGTIRINSNSQNSPQQISLSGTGK